MKSVKKLLAVLLTAALIIACIPVVLAASDNGDPIIENTVEGKQYDLYRVLDLNYSTAADDTPIYSYVINNDFSDFFKNVKGTGWYESDNAAYHKIKELTASELSELADELIDWALDNKVNPTALVTADNTTTKVQNIPYGYYLLNPLAASGTPQDGYTTMFSLDTLSGDDNTIIMKAQYPTVKKTFADETTAAKALSVGDTVDYKLTASVPNVTGYDKYFFVIRDEMDPGLDFVGIKSLHMGTVELKSENNDFDVYTSKTSDDKTAVEIVFNDFFGQSKACRRKYSDSCSLQCKNK